MTFALYSDVRETTTTTGTGALTLGGAVTGYVAFSARYSNGDTMFVSVRMGANWETFLGTFASGGNTITRTKMFRSTNGNAAVNWGAGTKDIFVTNVGPSELDVVNKGRFLGAAGAVLENYLSGLTLSNNGAEPETQIDIAAGVAADATNALYIRLAASITKDIESVWAVGTGNGGLDTGSVDNDTYHVWLIMRSDTSVVDVLFSLSATSPTMPADYDYKRRIGSILVEGDEIVEFDQHGDEFVRKVAISSSAANPGTSAVTFGCNVPGRTKALLVARVLDATPATAVSLLITSVEQDDEAASSSLFTFRTAASGAGVPSQAGGPVEVWTDDDAEIRYRLETSDADISVGITQIGWRDLRGRS